MTIHSYSSILNIGHKGLANLFNGPVQIEEKYDGSQFSFGIIDGELQMRTKSAQLVVDAPEKMFTLAVQRVKAIEHLLRPGYVYRGEYLAKPKHNVIVYDRVPLNNIMIFDISDGNTEFYLDAAMRQLEAERLGFESANVFYFGPVTELSTLTVYLDTTSWLGGAKIEGFVVKNYEQFGLDHKVLMGKYVSEKFKEVMAGDWRERNPTQGDVLQQLIMMYRTPARWEKARIHLMEKGELTETPKDIGALIKEVQIDVKKEAAGEIADFLYRFYEPKIMRAIIAGLPEWYKLELAHGAFDETNGNVGTPTTPEE